MSEDKDKKVKDEAKKLITGGDVEQEAKKIATEELDALSEVQEGETTLEERLEAHHEKYRLAMHQTIGFYLNQLDAELGDDTQAITMELIMLVGSVMAEVADYTFVRDVDKDFFLHVADQVATNLLEELKEKREKNRPEEAKNSKRGKSVKPGDITDSGFIISG